MSYLEGAVVVMEVVAEDVCVSCEEEAVEPEIAKLRIKMLFLLKQKLNLDTLNLFLNSYESTGDECDGGLH